MRTVVKPFWSSPPAGLITWSSSLAFGIAPAQSARGLAHSKTLAGDANPGLCATIPLGLPNRFHIYSSPDPPGRFIFILRNFSKA